MNDLRFAFRQLRKSPGFTFIAVLTLALGIGANTAIFTVVHAVFLETLPYRDAPRIVAVWETNARRPGRSNVVGPANFLRWQERATSFEAMAAFAETRANLTGTDNPEEVVAQNVTAPFFSVLGVTPKLGRLFTAEESADPQSAVVILSEELWQRRFGADPGIVGQAIQLNGKPQTVVGVMPAGVRLFLKTGSLVGKPADLWSTYTLGPEAREPRGRYLSVIGRLKSGVNVEAARAEMNTISASLASELPTFDTGWGTNVLPLREELAQEVRPALFVLSAAVAFVLLIACANVANLLLARGSARQHELSIRTALGATRGQIIRQLLLESLLLGIIGGCASLLVAQWGLSFLEALSPVELTMSGRLTLSYPILGFTAAISILTALGCGLASALEGSRDNAQRSLVEGGRQIGAGLRHRRLRHSFVVAEIALAVVLLVGAGLMLRSLASMRQAAPGFDSSNVLTMRMQLPRAKYPDETARIRHFRELTARVAVLPGVESVGAVSFLPMAGLGAATSFTIDGQPPPPPGQKNETVVSVCDNGFFQALKIPLIRGRLFTQRETQEKSNVVIVNEAQARFSARLLMIFAGLALVLAAVGIYGVMSYAVSQRTSEIGVRLALGAEERDILRMIIGDGARLAGIGLGIGALLALALSRALTSLLYGTLAADPLTYATVIGVLGVITLAACYLPARRASRIPPVQALRYQ